MHQITTHLVKLAEEANVEIKYNTTVETLNVESNNKIASIKSNGVSYPFDIVASDIDMHSTNIYYQILLPKKLQQEKSSSAYVFYWNKKRICSIRTA
jgi:phytoene dehydrogenase-like protein